MTVGNWGNFFIGAFFWIVFASIINPDLYGRLNLWISISTFFSTFGLFGMNYLIISFYPKTKDDILISQAFTISLFFSIIASIPIIFLGFFKSFNIIEILLMCVFEIMVVFATITFAIQIAKKQYLLFFYSIIALRILRIGIGILLFVFLKDIKCIIIGFIVGTFPLLYLLRRNIKFLKIKLVHIKNYYNDIFWLYILSLVSASITYLDKVVVWLVSDDWSLGIYQFSFQIYQIMVIVPITLFLFILGGEKQSSLNSLIISIVILGIEAIIIIPTTIFLLPLWFPSYVASPMLILTFAISIIPYSLFSYESGKKTKNQEYNMVVLSIVVGFIILTILLIVFSIFADVTFFGIPFVVSNTFQYLILLFNSWKEIKTNKNKLS
ncbi:MAG: hypothetical protein ACTSRP_09495 [Candidatus Helarchaeota archaeon]